MSANNPVPSSDPEVKADASRALRRQAAASARFALPFAITITAVGFAFSAFGIQSKPWLGTLLAVSLFVPALVELILRTPLPRALQLHYLLFMVAGPFAGSVLSVYGYLPWWDTLIHFDSGVMLAWLGMLAVRRAEERIGVAVPLWFALIVVQMTPMAFAAAWEVSEYASDLFIGTNAQLGLVDTMDDIIAGTVGGLLAIALMVIFRGPRTLVPTSLLEVNGRKV